MASIVRHVIKPSQSGPIARLFCSKGNPTIQEVEKLTHEAYKPTKLEQKILVWTGKFRNTAEIPKLITPEKMEHAKSKARIRLVNYMMLATAFACLVVVISGKTAHQKGESVTATNLEWHRRINAANATANPKEAK